MLESYCTKQDFDKSSWQSSDGWRRNKQTMDSANKADKLAAAKKKVQISLFIS